MTGRDPIRPPATLGVVGGGQLGRMFAQAAQRMGYRIAVLSTSANSPAALVADRVVVGKPDDLPALRELATAAEAITVEFENVSAAGLRWLARQKPVRPGWKSIRVAQDRIREKSFLAELGVPLPGWRAIRREPDVAAAASALGGPVILKTAASGYDGKGQVRVQDASDLAGAWDHLGRVPCVVERLVDFSAEVSCVVARGVDGASACYPIFWNTHRDHILDATMAPAPIGPAATAEARAIATTIAERLDHVGLLTVECFLTREGSLLVNELAPRPHNSAHLTIEAAAPSQFEQQVRALCGLPLGPARLVEPAAMVNLLGELWSDGPPHWDAALRVEPEAAIHLYGKEAARRGRKMGHLTVCDPDPLAALARARAARAALTTHQSDRAGS